MPVAFLVLHGFGKDVKPPPPPPKPQPLQTKIIPKSVSDENSSKPKATITPKLPNWLLPKEIDWSDFTYNSPEEKAFWDELPDWSGKILVGEWNSNPFIRGPDGFRRNAQGEIIKSNSSEGFNGYVKRGNNGYRTIYQFVDGYAVRSKSWWKDGRKWKELDYKEGKQDGLETVWGGNGQKIAKGNYKNVQKHGLETWWYDNGQKKSERNYKDGKLHGLSIKWFNKYDPGDRREEYYKDGKLHGLSIAWYKGQKSRQNFKYSQRNYKDGKKDGPETSWFENGQKQNERNYKNNNKDWLETWWYDNGQKRLEGKWKNRKNDGLHTEWYKDGQQKQELHYKDGKLSYAKVWLPDGKECLESKVIDGNGTLVTYSLDGKEISRRNIKAGTIVIPRKYRPIFLPIPKRPSLSESNSTTRPVPARRTLTIPPRKSRTITLSGGRTITIPPRNPRPIPIPKRPVSSEANSSKPLPPPLPKILPQAPPPPPPVRK